jgi:hypothetical protein
VCVTYCTTAWPHIHRSRTAQLRSRTAVAVRHGSCAVRLRCMCGLIAVLYGSAVRLRSCAVRLRCMCGLKLPPTHPLITHTHTHAHTQSYRTAILETAKLFGAPITHADVNAAKALGGANNDWKLTHTLVHKHKGSDGSNPSLQVFTRVLLY